MRLAKLSTWMMLGGGALAFIGFRRRRAARRVARGADELPTDLPADPLAEIAEDLAHLVPEDVVGTADSPIDVAAIGTDELGSTVIAPPEAELPDDDQAPEGQNWMEQLATSAVEDGPDPERALDMRDDDDDREPTHRIDTRDIPLADLGSAGPRGM